MARQRGEAQAYNVNRKLKPSWELGKQADAMRKNIESEFAKLRQYLRDEEKVLMGKIKKKEDHILQQLEDNLKAVSTERAMLNERIMEIQQRMTMKDAEILKVSRRCTSERCPDMPSGKG
ncbi:hypothetical protein chiPu_0022227 [Chiloscyllium punctatum]|uniref:Uncharacterized protein n=1 Tax=Chiloscyllium punctatum TaxID=137246 RepID=A0A401REM3_CHIPU|nr:hypothetical protein [Chiloscyllium punctatum]